MSRLSIRCLQLLMWTLLVFGSGSGFSQSYPYRAVRFIVPFAAGGAVDTIARAMGQKLSEAWKQPVVVDNRPGAGGIIASEVLARAPADGYTYLLSSISQAVTPSIYKSLPYDPIKDIVPVTQLVSSALVITINPQVPANSLKEFIALAKAKPRSMNYGSTGLGTSTQLLAELLKIQAGIDLVHVPYKGDAPQVAALMSGEVQIGLGPLISVLPHIRAGRLRAVAILGDRRLTPLPDVPTMAEAGVEGFELTTSWVGAFAPGGIPAEPVARLYAEVARIVALPDIKDLLVKAGYEPVGNSPQEFASRYRADLGLYARIVKEAHIPVQ